ncbi:hypothetical protein O6H91_Y301800 [Diphasiastrum complanatum]|nr:hypothetical protein O6H91_Y301800 [Diphasiastrum complanatum]
MDAWARFVHGAFHIVDKSCPGDCIPLRDLSHLWSWSSHPAPFLWQAIVCGIELMFMSVFLIILVVTRRHFSYGSIHSRSLYSPLVQFLTYLTSFAGLANIGVGTWYLVRYWSRTLSPAPVYSWIAPLVQGIVWLMLSFTLRLTISRPLSKFLRIWWVSTFVLISLTTFSAVLDLVQTRNISVEIVVTLATWPVGCLLFVLALKTIDTSGDLSEPLVGNNRQQNQADITRTPFANANIFSRVTFLWLTPLLALGYKRPLQQKDLPRVAHDDEAEVVYNAFARAWEEQKAQQFKSSSSPSVFWTLATCHWKDLAYNGVFALFKTVTLSCGPLLLNSFVNYARGKVLFKYEGFVLVAVLFLAKVVESISQRQWYFGSRRIGMHLHSALIGAIYQKALCLSSIGRQSHAAGEIVNYMAVDAYRIGEFPYWIHFIWTTPLQVIFALAILFASVGWATLAGLVVIILTMVANSPLAQLQQKYQTQLMKAQDERLRETSEVLRNMKILKLQTWELKFKSLIYSLREVECKWLSAVQFRKTFNTLVFWLSPVLVSTATFVTCYLFGIPLNANNVFTALATLRIVQEPIRVVPDLVAVIIQVRVSLSRLGSFLQGDELDMSSVERHYLKDNDYAIEMKDATLSWDPLSLKPTLQYISFHVKHGERVAVCGEVGSGKSSLLSGILGEISKLSGVIRVSGSTAYVSQIAWIQSGTIRDNILFGLPMDKARYNITIRACELNKDIELFPFGDLTEIGERGLNMSGGQKQRIQLARALYQDADIYLLDDPFSAVDAQTGSSLFQNCIMGALANKTVILVTHQVEFLPAFDVILVLLYPASKVSSRSCS